MARFGCVGALLALSLVVGCRRAPRPNVLLISIDALRADHLPTYGYQKYGYELPTAPFLDELALEGLVFDNAFVNTHGTTPSHTTMLSGLYQKNHGVGLDSVSGGVVVAAIPESIPLVQQLLRDQGYATIGVTGGGNAGHKFGFGRGFDRFNDRGGGIEKISRRLLAEIEDSLRSRPEQPIFAFLHTYEVHSPYKPPAGYRARFGVAAIPSVSSHYLLERVHAASTLPAAELEAIVALYDAGIRYTDDTLRALFEELEGTGFLDHCWVIVTADHGEEFGEHGGLLHRDLLYDELLHVPLIVKGPGLEPGRSQALASTVDIVPTLLDALGIEASPLDGSSLLAPDERDVVWSQYGRSRRSLRTAEWKLIHTPPDGYELYRLTDDPAEQHNLAAEEPALRARLAARLDAWAEWEGGTVATGEPVALDAEAREQLESLGYLSTPKQEPEE